MYFSAKLFFILFVVISVFSIPTHAELYSRKWDDLAKENYILGYITDEIGCAIPAKTFNLPKKGNDKRKAMTLYQIIHFAYNLEEDGNGEFYKRQFTLPSVPNDIGESRWNGVKYIIPYTIDEMRSANQSKVVTNNPQNDLSIYIASDLGEFAVPEIEKLIEKRVNDAMKPMNNDWNEQIKTTKAMTEQLMPLFKHYGVKITDLPDEIEDCN